MPDVVHEVAVDHSEARSALLEAVRRSASFEVRMADLPTGDYLINNEVLTERKSAADFLMWRRLTVALPPAGDLY